MRRLIVAVLLCVTPQLLLAEAGDERVIEMWQCKLKDGQKMEDVKATNARWLAMTRKEAGSDEVRSYALEPVVGEIEYFVFADTYPNLAAWSAGKSAEESDEGKAITESFDSLMDCTKNRLFNSTEH